MKISDVIDVKSGPKTDPCGTPERTTVDREFSPEQYESQETHPYKAC